ncbi:MAG: DNA recombination protein RmuC [Chitinophagaceae bacterium]
MTILYLAAGILIGAIAGYLSCKVLLLKSYVPKIQYDQLQEQYMALKVEASAKISREDLAKDYVNKELYNIAIRLQEEQKQAIQLLQQQVSRQQSELLQLTAASEKKLEKEVVDKYYVPRETFDIVHNKLSIAEGNIREKDTTILQLNTTLAELKKEEANLNEKLSTFKSEIEALHKLSEQQFKNLATDILEEKKKLFVETNKTELGNIISPLKADLDSFKKTVEETRKEDIRDLTSLKTELDSLHKLNVQLSDDARNLANALKSDTRVQGAWGEDRLKLILESEGLQKYIDYKDQEAYFDEEQERQRKPDFVLNLPNGKHIIIDSKVSLTAYVNYCNAGTPEEKRQYLKLHLKSITDHIDMLADKNYHLLAGINSPDYVFMFMPIESAVTLALNENPDIFNRALNKKIVLITPTTLVATLKVVKIIWQKENQVRNVQEIFKQCGLLYDKFVLFIEEMDRIGGSLQNAQKSYKEAMDRLKEGARKGDTIIGKFETIKKLEAKTNKSIAPKFIAEIALLEDDVEESRPDNTAIELNEPDEN